jgi:hypothetical protein
MDELYGRSPALEVLLDIVRVNEAPEEERVYAAARFVEEKEGFVIT